ncbi:MAG: hypothetical protein JRJ66_11015 [Deltaproteobacteria bacterium]|nr:hypothetical protein [Deltaproteobacteria bacterium]MBW2033127.1 hypothetical protein [Deltaproteobacteria bacterium]MBW2301502.1 hypothetical protein [Deltaproteobacteria bacterium]
MITEFDVRTIRSEGTPWNAAGNIQFDYMLDIALTQKTTIKSIDVSVDNNDVYEIRGLQNGEWILITTIYPKRTPGLVRHKIHLDNMVLNVDKVRIVAISGDGMYSLGHLLVNTQ